MKRINKFRALLCSCFAVAVLTMGCAMGASAKTSNFSEHTISAGTKMYYWSGDDYLSLPAYTKLTMNFQFNKSISSATGLRYSGYDVMNEAKNGNGGSASWTLKYDANVRAIIKNNSTSTVTVKSGSLVW
ncbi:hypothetical protein [Ruminococcus sp.]|jgi:hypothetical protein|uniref:hypothetical protein n=1 Tax=Ruminococcus sp. TaxID=41978 RepID=UPI002E777500|nr:hypothetical protein [Ruminococcus sp.]MEE0023276.1 hypothetical protein [Ruminococcus sp.]